MIVGLGEALSVRARAADLETMSGLLAPPEGLRLLDLGGGSGAATARFSAGLRDVVVLEPNRRKVTQGRRRRPSIQFQEGHAESIPFPDESFDRATAVVSFHHMTDQTRALAEIRRVLKVSGRVVLFELPPTRAPGRIMQWLAGYRHGGHMPFHGPDELQEKLRAGGFRDVTTREGVKGYFVVGTK